MNETTVDEESIELEPEEELKPLHERGREGWDRKIARRREAAKQLKELAKATAEETGDLTELGSTWRAVCLVIGRRLLTGEIAINNARDAKAVADVAFNIARLEDGQPTDIGEIRTSEQRMKLFEDLTEKARERGGLSVVPDVADAS